MTTIFEPSCFWLAFKIVRVPLEETDGRKLRRPLSLPAEVCRAVSGQRQRMRSSSDKGNMVSAGIGSADRVAVGGEHAAFERRAILARSPHQPYAAKMDRERELKIIRRAYGKQVTAAAGVGDPQVEAAFAAVAREDFLGPGPWHIVRWGGGYRATPDADPVYLYSDDVIGILAKRNLNNGQPSLHAALIAAAAPQPGEHVLHIGVGVGYYTAILAELVGATGRMTAIEYDAELAARATANLAQTPHVRVVHGDGTRIAFEPADVIYVNAGARGPRMHGSTA